MRQIYNTAKIQVRSLENLNIEIYGPLLIPVLLLKLSRKLSLIIKRQLDKKTVGKKNKSQNIRMGKVIYHYQCQIKTGKPPNVYFVTKQIINPSFVKL